SDIMDFARGRLGGGIPAQRRRMDLSEVCKHTVEELAAAYPNKTIQFHADGNNWGRWDADRVAQVISNLVSNAVQHGQKDTPIETTVADAGEHVELSVHNQGPPIPTELIPVLFEPFHRGAGLGLGLFIVKAILDAHGASITVRSTATEGTTFCIRWP